MLLGFVSGYSAEEASQDAILRITPRKSTFVVARGSPCRRLLTGIVSVCLKRDHMLCVLALPPNAGQKRIVAAQPASNAASS